MKKTLSFLLVVITIVLCGTASGEISTAFTHPEIGEFIIMGNEDNMPFFTIYDFTQYRIISPTSTYRGISNFANGFPTSHQISVEEVLDHLFDSIEGKSLEPVPISFEYSGALTDYSYELELLNKQDRIRAIRRLAGFDGIKGYKALGQSEGFDNEDIQALTNKHSDFTINLGNRDIPYRVLMFYFEEEAWEEAYYERYSFIFQSNKWILHMITKEYYSDYRQRIKYIHGLAAENAEQLQIGYSEMLQGYTWETVPSQILGSLSIDNNVHVLKNSTLFRLPATATFFFENDWLSTVQYDFVDSESYYAAFVSLYMRFYDPVSVNENGDITWSLPNMQIVLKYSDESTQILLSPRVEMGMDSVG